MSSDKITRFIPIFEDWTNDEKREMAEKLLNSIQKPEPTKEVAQDEPSKDKTAKETRNVGDFISVTTDGCVDVYIHHGDRCSVQITTDRENMKLIDAVVEDGVLILESRGVLRNKKSRDISGDTVVMNLGNYSEIISYNGIARVFDYPYVRVDLTMPTLNSCTIDGGGNLTILDDFSTDMDLILNTKGCGNISLKRFSCTGFACSTQGSGNIKAEHINSSGEFIALTRGTGSVDIVSVFAKDLMELHAVGTGRIKVNGCTNLLQVETSGMGSITGDIKYNRIFPSREGFGRIYISGCECGGNYR